MAILEYAKPFLLTFDATATFHSVTAGAHHGRSDTRHSKAVGSVIDCREMFPLVTDGARTVGRHV